MHCFHQKRIASNLKRMLLTLICIIPFWWVGASYGLNLMAKPMNLELYLHPGEKRIQPIEITNTASDKKITINARLFPIIQKNNGNWGTVSSKQDKHHSRSYIEWSRLSNNTLEIDPLQKKNLEIVLDVPRNARGTYGAVVILSSIPRKSKKKVAVAIRFLIPVLINVKGPGTRKSISFPEMGMDFHENLQGKNAETTAWIRVNNNGDSLVRVRGDLDIMIPAGKKWKRFVSVSLPEKMVIPGADFKFNQTIKKSLPSGKYQLNGRLFVDGRRHHTVKQEITFKGDPDVHELAADVPLMIHPGILEIESMPGARRTKTLTLENNGENPIIIQCMVEQPEKLKSVMMGDIKGDDFSCHTWSRISPKKFTLKGGRKRNIRVMVSPPKTAKRMLPFHFGMVRIVASHADGQHAGAAKAYLIVKHPRIEPLLRVQEMGMHLEKSKSLNSYDINIKFGNTGTAPLDLKCSGKITDGMGIKNLVNFELDRQPGLILPLDTPRFNGTIDFSGVAPGTYVLNTLAAHGDKTWPYNFSVRVGNGNKGKIVKLSPIDAK